MTTLASLLIALGLGLLDKKLDAVIDGQTKLTKEQKQALRDAEDELIRLLRDALKKLSPRIVSVLGRAIPNDSSTGNWG